MSPFVRRIEEIALGRGTKILLAAIALVGLCVALGVFVAVHYRLASGTEPADGAPPPPTFDIERGERVRRAALGFQRLLAVLDEDFEKGAAELRAFMTSQEGTGWAAEGHIQLATRYAQRGATAEALAELEALLALPDQGRRAARANLLKAQLLASSDEPAARAALDGVRKDARFPDLQMKASYQLGAIGLARGEFDKAIALLKPVLGSGVPEKVPAREALEKAVLGRFATDADAGRWQAAIAWADANIQEFPDLATLHHALRYRQAGAYRRLGQFAKARVYVERLRRDVPKELLSEAVDVPGELAAIAQAEEAAGIRRTRDAFLRAKQAGQESRPHVEGELAADARWDPGPLVLAGPVVVKRGATLTIAPGAVVGFLDGARLTVEGALVASGTAERPIRFTSAVVKAPTFFDGGGVELAESRSEAQSVLEHCVFEYQRTGLVCRGAAPVLRGCTFRRNGVEGLLLAEFAAFAVEGCTFEGNDGVGLHARGARSELAVRRCRVVRNGRDGISLTSLSGKLDAAIDGNHVVANGGHGIVCDLDVAATISANLIADNRGDGIYLNRFSRSTIRGNILRANRGAGIRCERDSAPEVVGNAILRSSGNAIALSRSGGTIRDNHLLGSASSAIFLAENSSPTIEGNWIVFTHGAGVQCAEGCVPTITGNLIAGFDPGPLGTLGRARILAQRNFFANLGGAREARRDPLVALEKPTWKPISDEQLDKLIFDHDNQPQLGEIVWRPRLAEPPPRPPIPELPDLP